MTQDLLSLASVALMLSSILLAIWAKATLQRSQNYGAHHKKRINLRRVAVVMVFQAAFSFLYGGFLLSIQIQGVL